MTDIEQPAPGHTYRIGAVARLTGIPPDTLRVWERRYGVVSPFRSEAGTRLYGAEDVGRLTLIKRLVDNGDAISHVAGLHLEALRERVRALSLRPLETLSPGPCRVVALGESLPTVLAQVQAEGQEAPVEYVGLFSDEVQFRAEAAALRPDLLLLECPTIHIDQVQHIQDLLLRSGASRGLLVYHFASRGVVERLASLRIAARRAPLEAAELRRWCASAHGLAEAPVPDPLAELDLAQPIPPRRYGSAELTRIAAASPTVRCECPHHLVQLVSSLVAFEAYSQECEHRNPDDAALHAYLHAATAHARATMEAALARVVEAEGILL